MTDRIPASLRAKGSGSPKAARKKPPTAGRILAASLSVASGIGLVGLLGAAKQPAEVIVQVAPTPVVIERTGTQNTGSQDTGTVEQAQEDLFVVQAAEPVPVAATQPEQSADTQSEGS